MQLTRGSVEESLKQRPQWWICYYGRMDTVVPTRVMTPNEIAEGVARIIRTHLGSEYRIFLFGSRADGTARRGSDYDIGIEGPRPIGAEKKFAIEEDIERDLPTLATIEIVDFSHVSDRFRQVAMLAAKDL